MSNKEIEITIITILTVIITVITYHNNNTKNHNKHQHNTKLVIIMDKLRRPETFEGE